MTTQQQYLDQQLQRASQQLAKQYMGKIHELERKIEAMAINRGAVLQFTYIEVKVNSTSATKFFLPDSDILRGKTVVGIANYPQRQVSASDTVFGLSGNAVVSETVLNGSFLTLEADSLRFIESMPLRQCNIGDVDREFLPVANVDGFNPTRSYIDFAGDTANLVASTSFVLGFFYIN